MDAVDLARRRPLTARVRGLLVAVALVLLWMAPDRAAAHAALVGSDPRDGASLASAPATVTLTFDEAIAAPAYVVVTAPDGTRVDDGDAEPTDGTVTQRLVPSAAPEPGGRWTVAYRVVSVDGHAITGELTFTVEVDTGSGQPAAASAGSAAQSPAAADEQRPFWREHAGYLVLGTGIVLTAALLLLWPGRRRDA